jgi:hypothetical protein
MLPHENFSDDEVLSRIKRYYGDSREIENLPPETYHPGTGNKDRFLSTDFGVAAFTNKGYRERIGLYREYVYEKGGISDGSVGAIPQEVLEEEREKGYRLTRKEVFRYRVRYFTEGLIIGSREFVRETAERIRETLRLKRERRPRKVGPVEGLYSFRAVP